LLSPFLQKNPKTSITTTTTTTFHHAAAASHKPLRVARTKGVGSRSGRRPPRHQTKLNG